MEESYVTMFLVYCLWYTFNVGWNDDGFIFRIMEILDNDQWLTDERQRESWDILTSRPRHCNDNA